MVDNVLSVIMGGGRGSRLFPLTTSRAKPSVPIAGKFRLIDIPISNCLHSGLRRIYVLTQFNSVSLNRHVVQTYRFDSYNDTFVHILAAQQTLAGSDWYQGTADAVRQNTPHLLNPRFEEDEHILILAGDHLYRMDYRKMLEVHLKTDADLTVSVIPVHSDNIHELGVLKASIDGRITDFVEKPKSVEAQQNLVVPEEVFSARGIKSKGRNFIASMGIYLFKRSVLEEVLSDEANIDFGRDIIPKSIHTKKVFAYFFDGYWEDIGTIRSFYDANLALTDGIPKFNFYDEKAPIYTRRRHLPSTKINSSRVESSILAEGSIVDNSEISRSIVGIRSVISGGTRVNESIVMGSDFYETGAQKIENRRLGIPHLGIGGNCVIHGAIIDKNARIGDSSTVVNVDGKGHFDGENYYIRDGVVIVPKGGIVPSGAKI